MLRVEIMPFIPTPPPFSLQRLDGMVGKRMTGPSPGREASNMLIRLSVPARKEVPEEHQVRDEGVRKASVVILIKG